MRLIIIGLLLVAVVLVIVSGLRGYKKHVSMFALLLCLVPAGTLGWFEYKWQETNTKLSAVVQNVSGNPLSSFACQRMSIGFFDTEVSKSVITSDPNTVHLKYRPCSELQGWFNQEVKGTPTVEQVEAIHYFAVEAIRVSGQTDPGKAECVGSRETPAIVQALGGSKNLGDYVSAYYNQHVKTDKTPTATC